MKNIDYIKSLDVEDMAEFIERLKTTYCQYNYACKGCIIEDLCDLPLSRTMQWLNEERKYEI